MPYRRLPNTDAARISALEKALRMELIQTPDRQPASFKILNEARVVLNKYKAAVQQFRYHYDEMCKSNKQFQPVVKMARLYISHFIQVFNMAVQRNEIKAEYKLLYNLDPNDHSLPDLASENDLVTWGHNIIEGENRRLARQGGSPIYNPTIAKVKVHYDIFIESRYTRDRYKKQMQRSLDNLNLLRQEVDAIILDIWNQVEAYYSTYPLASRIKLCSNYGIIYYYRKNEKRPE